mmetsp:Transcript_46034/g.131875  ORF Transcript_46034/g.131875 Transcript_46034/m.131875 type:complete len:250 (+) Transcript_46034:438-1187(+)
MSLPRWRSMVRRAKYGATQTRPRRGRLSQTFLSHGATGRRRKPPWRVMTSQTFSTTWSHRPSCLRLPHRPQPCSSPRLFRRRRCTLRLWVGRRCLLIRWRRPMLSSGQPRTGSMHRCSRTMGSNSSSSSSSNSTCSNNGCTKVCSKDSSQDSSICSSSNSTSSSRSHSRFRGSRHMALVTISQGSSRPSLARSSTRMMILPIRRPRHIPCSRSCSHRARPCPLTRSKIRARRSSTPRRETGFRARQAHR